MPARQKQPKDPTVDELSPPEAKALIRTAVSGGGLSIDTPYFKKRMDERSLVMPEIEEVLSKGDVLPAEYENGEWRYRVWLPKQAEQENIVVVVSFEDRDHVVAITAYREKLKGGGR